MRDGPALTVNDNGVRVPATGETRRATAVVWSLRLRRRLRAVVAGLVRYDSWVWRLALVLGVAAYGLAMAIAMSARPHL